MLFIRKSASNIEYLRQNLAILSAPNGTIVETRYRTRWIEPTVLQDMSRRGDPVCILFADPPYEWQLPVRFAVLESDPYLNEDGSYVFRLGLGRFADIPLEGPPRIGNFPEEGTDWFVYHDSEVLIFPSDEPESVAWRWIIQHIVGYFPERGPEEQPSRRMERYLSSFFFRPASFRDDQNDRIIDPAVSPLHVGRAYAQVIDCYAPHISPARISQWELVGQAEPAVADVLPVLATADGQMGMRIIPRLPGATSIKVWVQPEQARSSQILIACQVEGETAQIPDVALGQDLVRPASEYPSQQQSVALAGTAGLSEAQTKALYFDLLASYERAGLVITDQDRLDLASRLIPFAAEQRFLVETHGVCLFRQSMFEGAWSRLSDLGLDRLREPEAVAGYFVSGWKTSQFTDIHHFIQRSDVTQWGSSLLMQVREALPWNQVIGQSSLMEDLYLLGVLNQDVFFGMLAQYNSGDFVRDQVIFGVQAGMIQPDAAYRFLLSWLQRSDQQTRRRAVAGLAIGYGLGGGFLNVVEIMDTYGERIVQDAGLHQIQEWREPIEVMFKGADRFILLERLAHFAAILDSEQSAQYAGGLLLEIAEQYLSRREYSDGEDLERAGYCIERARGLLTTAPQLERKLTSLEKTWIERAGRTEVVRDYLAQFEKHRVNEIKGHVKGKVAVIVGGLKQEFDPNKLAKELGFKNIEHIELWGHKSNLTSLTNRIRDGQVDYVFDRIGFGPHRDEVRNSCRTAQQNGVAIPYLALYRSINRRVLVEALWQYHFESSE